MCLLGSDPGTRRDQGFRLPHAPLRSPVGWLSRDLLAVGGKASTSGKNPVSVAYPGAEAVPTSNRQKMGLGLDVGEWMGLPGLEEVA